MSFTQYGSILYINNNNIGIGKTNPSTIIDVNGSITGTFSGIGTSISNLNASNISSGTLSILNGGIGSSTLTNNSILVGNATNNIITSTNFVWDNTNTRVGIGKTNPSTTLDVNGTITGTLYNGPGSSLNNININNVNTGILTVNYGGTGRNTLTTNSVLVGNGTGSIITPTNFVWTNNNVGIGKTNPTTTLDVNGTITGTYSGSGASLSGLNATNIVSGTLSTSYGGTGLNTLTSGSILAASSISNSLTATNNLVWDNSNNRLGIGVSVPLTSLHIKDTYILERINALNIKKTYEYHSQFGNILYSAGTNKYMGYKIEWANSGIRNQEIYVMIKQTITGACAGFIRCDLLVDTSNNTTTLPGLYYELDKYTRQISNISNLNYSVTRVSQNSINLYITWDCTDNAVTHMNIDLYTPSELGALILTEQSNYNYIVKMEASYYLNAIPANDRQYAYLDNVVNLSSTFNNGWSLSMWINIGNLDVLRCSGQASGIFCLSASNSNFFSCYIGMDGKIYISHNFLGSASYTIGGAQWINNSTWHHVVVTMSSTRNNFILYVDGSLIGTLNSPTTMTQIPYRLTIGHIHPLYTSIISRYVQEIIPDYFARIPFNTNLNFENTYTVGTGGQEASALTPTYQNIRGRNSIIMPPNTNGQMYCLLVNKNANFETLANFNHGFSFWIRAIDNYVYYDATTLYTAWAMTNTQGFYFPNQIFMSYVGTGRGFEIKMLEWGGIKGVHFFTNSINSTTSQRLSVETFNSGVDEDWMHIYIRVNPTNKTYEFFVNGVYVGIQNVATLYSANTFIPTVASGNAAYLIGYNNSGGFNGYFSDFRIYGSTTTPGVSLTNAQIAGLYGLGPGFSGSIDEIGLWNSTLSAANVSTIYASSSGINTVSPTTLKGKWSFTSGSSGNDSSSSGNNLTLVDGIILNGDVPFTNTINKYTSLVSLYLDGTTYLYANNYTIWDISTNAFSVGMWIKIPIDFSGNRILWSLFSGSGVSQISYSGGIDSSCRIITSATGAVIRPSHNYLQMNDWHHIVWSWSTNRTAINLYINGLLCTEVVIASGTPGTVAINNIFRIGGPATADIINTNFYGNIDEVGVWNISLNSVQVNQMYSGGPRKLNISYDNYLVSTNVIGYWTFMDLSSSSTFTLDYSNNGGLNLIFFGTGFRITYDIPTTIFSKSSLVLLNRTYLSSDKYKTIIAGLAYKTSTNAAMGLYLYDTTASVNGAQMSNISSLIPLWNSYSYFTFEISDDGNTLIYMGNDRFINVFEKTNNEKWCQKLLQTSNTAKRLGPFGGEWEIIRISSDGSIIVVLGYHENSSKLNAGSSGTIFIYQRGISTWAARANNTETQVITNTTNNRFAQFGNMSKSGNMLAISNHEVANRIDTYYQNIGTSTWTTGTTIARTAGNEMNTQVSPYGSIFAMTQGYGQTYIRMINNFSQFENIFPPTLTVEGTWVDTKSNMFYLASDYTMAVVTKTNWYIYQCPYAGANSWQIVGSGQFTTTFTSMPAISSYNDDGVLIVFGDTTFVQVDTKCVPIHRMIPTHFGTVSSTVDTSTFSGIRVETFTGADSLIYKIASNVVYNGSYYATYNSSYGSMLVYHKLPAGAGQWIIVTLPDARGLYGYIIQNGEGGGWTGAPTQRYADAWTIEGTNDINPWTGTPSWTIVHNITSRTGYMNNILFENLPSSHKKFTSYRFRIDTVTETANAVTYATVTLLTCNNTDPANNTYSNFSCYPSFSRSDIILSGMYTNTFHGNVSPAYATYIDNSNTIFTMVKYKNNVSSTNDGIYVDIKNSPYTSITAQIHTGQDGAGGRYTTMFDTNGDVIRFSLDDGYGEDWNLFLYKKVNNYSSTAGQFAQLFLNSYQASGESLALASSLGYSGFGDLVCYGQYLAQSATRKACTVFRINADRLGFSTITTIGSGVLPSSKSQNGLQVGSGIGSSALIFADKSNNGFVIAYVNTSNFPHYIRYSYNGTSYVAGINKQIFAVTVSFPTISIDDLPQYGGLHVFLDGSILFMYKTKRIVYSTGNEIISNQGTTNGDTGMNNIYFGSYKGYAIVRMGDLATPNNTVRVVNRNLQEIANFGYLPTLKYMAYNESTNKLLFVDNQGFTIKDAHVFDKYYLTRSISLTGNTAQILRGAQVMNCVTTQPFTWSIWFRWSGSANQNALISNGNATDSMVFFGVTSTYYRFALQAPTGNTVVDFTQSVPTNTWIHAVIVNRPGIHSALYVNGIEYIGAAYTGTYVGGTEFTIGNYYKYYAANDNNYAFNGLIDEVGIWNNALTAAEIAVIYNNGISTNLSVNSGNYISSGNLQAYYRWESNNGYDYSGNNRNLTLYGSPSFTNDIAFVNTNSLSLNGSTQYCRTDMSNWMLYTNYTVSAWIRRSSIAKRDPIYFPYIQQSSYNHMFVIESHNKLRMFQSANSTNSFDGLITINANTWYHVAFTWNASNTVTLYVNGNVDTSFTFSANPINAPGTQITLQIGEENNRTVSSIFQGLIEEYGIWNSALTAAEITSIYNSGKPINLTVNNNNYASSSSLQAYWRFDKNDGRDSSGYGRNLTMYGSPTTSSSTP